MKVAVLGFGSQGISACAYWRKNGHEVTVCDKDRSLKLDGMNVKLGDDYLAGLSEFDVIVRSPSIHPKRIFEANPDFTDLAERLTSNTNEFMRVCPTKNIIGVTGTKGKGTTSTLIARMLEESGKKVHLGGNIGTPPLDLLKANIMPDDWVVLELANFQLIDLKSSPKIAVCVRVEPEHLDWHTDEAEYVRAKQQLFRWQSEDGLAVYYEESELSKKVASISPATKLAYFGKDGAFVSDGYIFIQGVKVCSTADIQLPGKHNWQNVCAAITAVWEVVADPAVLTRAISSVRNLPFRIELRKEVRGVKYINDSFATAPGATIAALDAVPETKILILGGYDRGLDMKPLCEAISRHTGSLRKVLVIGASADRIVEALQKAGFENYTIDKNKDMDAIVRNAASIAETGDAVLLSPAFASFDMFKNFEQRGIAFNQAVDNL